MENLIIVGLGINANNVYKFVKMYNLYNIIGFAVNEKYKTTDSFCGLPVFSLETIKSELKDINYKVFIAVLWNHLNADRRTIYEYCKKEKFDLTNLISPHAVIRGELLGDNCWIQDFVVIKNNARIESNVMLMEYVLIGSNSQVGAHCFFGVRSMLGGESIVGEQTFVGLNATIFDGTHIGKKCIVGACTAVKRNMPDFSKYSTASDNIVIKQYAEDEIEEKLVASKNVR